MTSILCSETRVPVASRVIHQKGEKTHTKKGQRLFNGEGAFSDHSRLMSDPVF